uniref:Uncharacterized protein n=1 Tax=Acrobeloides nanus TaxID=290746 RepID=A0A914CXM6_9BILA
MFDDLLTCQWLCEEQPRYSSKACMEPFDEHYRDECNGGKWKQQYFYDKSIKKCSAFWFDGCTGTSQNLFQDEITCIETCERAANEYDEAHRRPIYNPENNNVKPVEINIETSSDGKRPDEVQPQQISSDPKSKDQSPPRTAERNICEIANPCKNNGTCLFDSKRRIHVCKCAPGWTNDDCSELIDYDPCASFPCKNGATCMAKFGKGRTTYECYCPLGYGGMNCDSRPCDTEPCKNNGTCRTTRTLPDFFCECQPGWGGRDCDIPIPNNVSPTYGKNVELISSGKLDWINELRMKEKQRLKDRTTKAPAQS